MVDYSFVKVNCPSVSFPFARLGCLLEIVEGKHSKGLVSSWGRIVNIGLSFFISFGFLFY